MAEAFIVRRGGGGGSGGTLVVTSSGAGTVTVSNTVLGKSYSKSVTAGGSVTFKGLKTGEWTVTLSNGAQTTTRSVTINADYSVSVAYFSATISVTYPAKSKCVVKNSSGQTVASDTNTTSSEKTFVATVNATGTYTVTATATDGSGKSKSTTVSITTDGQSVSVTLSYNFVLFAAGSGLAAGYTAESKTTSKYSFTDSALVFNSNNQQGLKGLITPAVDLTDFSKMFVTYKDVAYYDVSDTGKGFVGVTDKEYSVWSQNNYNTPGFPAYIRPSAGEGTQELDISGLSGNYYFVLSGDWFAITVTSIIFE